MVIKTYRWRKPRKMQSFPKLEQILDMECYILKSRPGYALKVILSHGRLAFIFNIDPATWQEDYRHQIGRASCRERVSSPV